MTLAEAKKTKSIVVKVYSGILLVDVEKCHTLKEALTKAKRYNQKKELYAMVVNFKTLEQYEF